MLASCGNPAVRLAVRAVATVTSLLLALGSGGCARRAYTDVYVENMAAEIRSLEDELVDYDAEYRSMEQQVAALRAENARLKALQGTATSPSRSTPSRNARPLIPENDKPDNYTPENFVPRGGSSSGSGSPPTYTPPSSTTPPASSSKSSPSPAPSLDAAPGRTDTLLPPATLPPPKNVPGSTNEQPFDLNDLKPPTIEHGEPTPPVQPQPKRDPNTPVTMHTDNDLEVELGQIKMPMRLASSGGASLIGRAPDNEAAVDDAKIHPVAEMPSDSRIVEVKFHPTLCRAMNSQGQGDDDGLYLVLQPFNESGQFVPVAADLMVLALDLSREEKQATIGRWTFSAADVKSKLNPIGSSQGVHLSLPFIGPAPQCDRVLVFAYYTLADGRRIVAEQEVMLNNFHRQAAVWVPRAKSEVRTASGERPAKRTR